MGNLSSKNMLGGGSNGSNIPLPFANNGRGSGGNPSQIVSAQKDSRGLASAGGLNVDSDSAQNLISKAQVHEVIKGLNVSFLS
jgi:hypothetical protein